RVGRRDGRQQGDRTTTVGDLDRLARLDAAKELTRALSQLPHPHTHHVLFVAHSDRLSSGTHVRNLSRASDAMPLPPTGGGIIHRGDGSPYPRRRGGLGCAFLLDRGRDFDAHASLEEMTRSVEV